MFYKGTIKSTAGNTHRFQANHMDLYYHMLLYHYYDLLNIVSTLESHQKFSYREIYFFSTVVNTRRIVLTWSYLKAILAMIFCFERQPSLKTVMELVSVLVC